MTDWYPLPNATANAVRRLPGGIAHPGLLLDRYAAYPTSDFSAFQQGDAHKRHLEKVRDVPAPADAAALLGQWAGVLNALPHAAVQWRQKTIWRLAAHLSRASTVENASPCLHSLFGFPLLTGFGLKGLARAQAVQSGCTPTDMNLARICGPEDAAEAGSVIFLEAWPETWPKLEIDIVNNHHEQYFQNAGAGGHAPGDWEAPNPTYFLAVPAGVVFRFGVTKRSAATPDADLAQARAWLTDGLCELGAGAKTAAGYGYFGQPL